MACSASTKLLVQCVLITICLINLVGSAVSLCNIESNKLRDCLPALSGKPPLAPDDNCCALIRQANLRCLCGYKNILPALGIDPGQAVELPNKCGLQTPRECYVP